MYKLTCCVAVAVAGLGGQAVAGIINVPSDQPTIQAGIDAAVNGDEVVVAPGVYQETVLVPPALVITVRSSDGPVATTIDANSMGNAVRMVTSPTGTVLDGFTITGGFPNQGRGVVISGGSPTVTNCIISNNVESVQGAGMAVSGGSPTISNCMFIDNVGHNGGGAMLIEGGTVTLIGCTFSGNTNTADTVVIGAQNGPTPGP